MTIQTPEQITTQVERANYNDDAWTNDPDYDGHPIDALADAVQARCVSADEIRMLMTTAVEADRRQWGRVDTESSRTPSEVALEIVNDETVPDEWSPTLLGDLRGFIVAAVELDRARYASDHANRDWTVIGAWIDDEPVPFGAVRGSHGVEGGGGGDYDQPWATSVEADSADEAIREAVAEMEQSEQEEVAATQTEQIARGSLDAVLGNAPSAEMDALGPDDYQQLLSAFIRAIESGRTFPDPVGDWADDARDYGSCSRIDVQVKGYGSGDAVAFYTDFWVTPAQVRGMFAGISAASD